MKTDPPSSPPLAAEPLRLPPMSADEDDLLDVAEDRDATSRLSCQLPVTAGLDGMRVTIAAED